MKNLIEVLFEFKDKGAEVIDQNREKLSEMALSMEEVAKQAGYLIKTQKEIDKSLNEGSDVVAKKTKAQREADKIERAAAKAREEAKKAELKTEKEVAAEQSRIAKEKAAEIKAQAKIENEAAKVAKAQAKEQELAEKQALAVQKQAQKEKQALLKQQQADEKNRLAQIKASDAEQKAIVKARLEQEKAGQKQTKEILAAQAAADKQKIAQDKELARQWQATQKQQSDAQKAADLRERNALVESMRLKRQKAQADKEAMLAANRAAREAERAAQSEVKSQQKATIAAQKAAAAAQKAADAQAKAAAKAAQNSGGSGGGAPAGNPSGDVSLLGQANEKMVSSIKNLKLIKLGVAGVAAAAVVAVAAFARQSADEFYKMKLSAETSGLDVKVLQEYKDVLDSVGISTDEFAQKLRQLNEKFVEGFTEASGDGMEVVKTLALDMKAFAEAAPEKKFEMIVDATKDLSKVQRLQIFDKLSLDNLNLVANRMDLINKKKAEIKKSGLFVTDEEAGRLKDFENSFNNFNNKIKTFSTIVYSAMIPALQDTFGSMFEGFDLSRDGANWFIEGLVSVIQFLGKITAFGKIIFDTVITQFKIWGTYAVAVADGLQYLYNKMSISIGGIVDILKNINIGAAIADLSSKVFSGIIDVVFDSMDYLVSGIEKLASSISGVLPDSILSQIKASRAAISSFRTNLFTYEQSEEAKNNDKIIEGIKERTNAEQDVEDAAWKEKQAKNRKNLKEVKDERQEDINDFAKTIVNINGLSNKKYTKTIEEVNAENKKEDAKLIEMIDKTEERKKQIDQLMADAETIRQKIDLGIKKADGSAYLPEDFLKLYDEAIAVAAGDAKLLNKEIELRLKKRDDELAFLNDQYSKKMDVIKSSLDNLKLLDEITEKPFGNKDEVLKKYDTLIALAIEYKKTEAEVNQLVLERKQYLDSYNEAQKKYITDISNLETQLLEAQDKGLEARAKKRAEALAQVTKDYANATEEQKAKALELTDNLFNINNAKARIAELNTEIDKLVDRRQNKTSILDREKLLEIEGDLNRKLEERNALEDELGIKREKNNKDFVLTLEVVKGILENTYTNFATLVSSAATGVESLGDATKKFFNDTLQYLAQLFQKMLVMKALNMLGSAFGFSAPMGAQAPIYHEGGMAMRGIDGNGTFPAMGPYSSKEMTATLNSREAILTETQQENLGNALASGGAGSGGNVTAVIHNNIDLPSLARGITETAEFRSGTINTITKDRNTIKQVLA